LFGIGFKVVEFISLELVKINHLSELPPSPKNFFQADVRERGGVEKGVCGISFKGLIMKQTTPLILVGLIFNEPILKQITPKVV
jgi:hypothetical protein